MRQKFEKAKALEKRGEWRQAVQLFTEIVTDVDPCDAHAYLALGKLQARRNNHTAANDCFAAGTNACPTSVHLWQAWAVHQESQGNLGHARSLYERALQLQDDNPYVCHAFGLMEYRLDDKAAAEKLWQQALNAPDNAPTAALVCSLGRLWTEQGRHEEARSLYARHVNGLASSPRQQTEVYLAMAWLEEHHFRNATGAEALLQQAIDRNPTKGVAQVALARLQGRRRRDHGEPVHKATSRRLANVCLDLEQGAGRQRLGNAKSNATKTATISASDSDQPEDGRVYNAWANMEVKARRYNAARQILRRGIARYPNDYTLLQAAGKVEERVGNATGARYLYSQSLSMQPSAPALVAYAMLELRSNFTTAARLFEESLLLDPRHGPAYNSYGNAHVRQGNWDEARAIFERGLQANCTDAASVYHGYARMELSLGNVKRAKRLLRQGMAEARRQEIGTDSPHRDRASFLTHTLGMLELNSHEPTEALAVFRDGIQRYGNSSQLLLGAALCETKLGNEAKARSLFERAVRADERHAQAWQAWGVMEMRAGNWNTSRTLFQSGIKNDPRHGALWLAYATLEGRLGNVETSRSLFAHGIKRARNHLPLYSAWASLELRLGNFTDAKTLITESLTRNKRNGAGWIVAAEIERELGNIGLVNLILRRGIECCPTYVELYRALGNSLLGSGKINEARQVFEKGIEIDPLHAPLYHSLAELEARVFNVDGLAKLNKRTAAIFKTDATSHSRGEEVWSQRIKNSFNMRVVPKDVVALAHRIVDEEDDIDFKTEPSELVQLINTNMLEGGYIDQLFEE